MNPETPNRKLSLRRKRFSREERETNGFPSKRTSPSYTQREENGSNIVSSKPFCKNSMGHSSESSPRNYKEINDDSNKFNRPIHSTPISINNILAADASPDFELCSSQVPGTPYCEVVWDCNTPGFTKEDLKKMTIRGSEPSPCQIKEEPNICSLNLRSRLPLPIERSNTNSELLANELDKLKTAINFGGDGVDSQKSFSDCTDVNSEISPVKEFPIHETIKREKLKYVPLDSNSPFKTPSKVSRKAKFKSGGSHLLGVSLKPAIKEKEIISKSVSNIKLNDSCRDKKNEIDAMFDDSFDIPDEITPCNADTILLPTRLGALSSQNKQKYVNISSDTSVKSANNFNAKDSFKRLSCLEESNAIKSINNSVLAAKGPKLDGSDLFDDDLIDDSFLLSTQMLEDQFYSARKKENIDEVAEKISHFKAPALSNLKVINNIKPVSKIEKMNLPSEIFVNKTTSDLPTDTDISPILGKTRTSPVVLSSSKNHSFRNLFGEEANEVAIATVTASTSKDVLKQSQNSVNVNKSNNILPDLKENSIVKPLNKNVSCSISTSSSRNSFTKSPAGVSRPSRMSFQLGDPKKRMDVTSNNNKIESRSYPNKILREDNKMDQNNVNGSKEKCVKFSSTGKNNMSYNNSFNSANASNSNMTLRSKSEVISTNTPVKSFKKNVSCGNSNAINSTTKEETSDFGDDDDEFFNTFMNTMESEDVCNLNRSMEKTHSQEKSVIKIPVPLNRKNLSKDSTPKILARAKTSKKPCNDGKPQQDASLKVLKDSVEKFKFKSKISTNSNMKNCNVNSKLHGVSSETSLYPTPESSSSLEKKALPISSVIMSDAFDDESFEMDVIDLVDKVESAYVLSQPDSKTEKNKEHKVDTNSKIVDKKITVCKGKMEQSESTSLLSRTIFPIKLEPSNKPPSKSRENEDLQDIYKMLKPSSVAKSEPSVKKVHPVPLKLPGSQGNLSQSQSSKTYTQAEISRKRAEALRKRKRLENKYPSVC